ncbi:male-specific lethal 1-like 1 [Alosa alosa]|uniref:male-specific lethal 1-like 1 n=1 Tax=Alosa sapidissima TaxID=34773 RepID=UPI001C07F9D3|nr:male-specific lethal 1-like 1 [Alosa sapidissima]XP_048089790.1 male-specific lethal 1-like 1 [Alosa alosa]
MTMRHALFTNARFKLDPEKLDLDKAHIRAGQSVDIRRDSCDFGSDVHNVIGDILKSGGQLFGKSRKLDVNHLPKSGRTPLATGRNKAKGPVLSRDASESAETLSSQVKHMGGEGTPVKTKTPLGQTNAVDVKTEPIAMNSHSNSRDAGTDGNARGIDGTGTPNMASLETSTDGKRKNIRKTPSHPHAQATCLRQILLLQLDLIEQQQQELQTKDKEIDELKSDRDTLLARIERMERRLQLISNAPRDKRLFQPLERWVPETDDFWEGEDGTQGTAQKNLAYGRDGKVQKRKFGLSDPKTPTQKPRGKAAKFSSQKTEAGGPLSCQRDLHKSDPSDEMGYGQSAGQAAAMHPLKEEPQETMCMEELPYMTTTEMYLCCWKQPPLSPLREASPKKEEDVDIPSWRENSMEPLNEKTDIPENLDDNVFLKRHSKLELDEKRRKRWDIQRIREQRMLQRLQQRMEKKVAIQETEPDLMSFYPETEDVESIVITPFLPVMAFGRPLPNLSPENFELPWLDDRSRCRVENQKKNTPHRNCRK